MIYVIYGNDRLKSLKVAEAILEKSSGERVVYDGQNFDVGSLLNDGLSSGLFGEKKYIKCDGVLTSDNGETIISHLEDFQKSANTFIFLEEAIKADPLKKLKKFAEKVEEFKLAEKKKEAFNIFQLSDAFGLRDRKLLWVLYTKALGAGKSGEEIAGTLFWQMKSMILVQSGDSSSLNPYVVSKAKQYLRNFKDGELTQISKRLIDIYHESRRGRYDLETALERLVLSI